MVAVRVRAGGRSGFARGDAGELGELDALLRAALADARLAEPSPDWPIAAATVEPVAAGAPDPEIVALTPAAAEARLAGPPARRQSLTLGWLEARVAVAASFHPVRSQRFTSATFTARVGRRPGSGFAARTAPSLLRLGVDEVLARAGALEASAIETRLPGSGPLVLGAEAAITLLDAFARRALGGRERIARGGAWPWPLAAGLAIDDDPLDGGAPALPFDLDGCPRARRRFVDGGRVVAAALDLELAARAGEAPTAHALAADDAWPEHLAVAPGAREEAALLADAAGGVRIGSLERLAVEPGDELPFRALARGLREIGPGGALGAALPPAVWTGSLREALSSLVEAGAESAAWAPDPASLGALRSPALRLAPCGRFATAPAG
jgi:predicted Zn-dependent protease